MNKVRYQFIADPSVKLTQLLFENAVAADPSKNTATLDVAVVNLLDIDIECRCSENCQGKNWKLFVWVDDAPIITPNQGGYIAGGISKNGTGSHYGGYEW
jgi:hypothetical protein